MSSFTPHDGENRKTRRKGVATFEAPADLPKDLRRQLVKQRQRNRLGKLDVETRRLQRKAQRK